MMNKDIEKEEKKIKLRDLIIDTGYYILIAVMLYIIVRLGLPLYFEGNLF